MIKYARIINKETGLVEVGIGTNTAFYKSIGMTQLDVQQSDIDGAWYLADKCPMKTDEQKAQEKKEQKIEELKLKLEELDKQRIRALCEPSNRTDDQTWLEYYNEQIVNIRKELQSLQN